MDARKAEQVLDEAAELVPCVEAGLPEAKRLLDACLAADIPARLWRDEGACGPDGCAPRGGCGPARVQLLVRDEDVPRVAQLLQHEWRELAQREGTVSELTFLPGEVVEGELPCPACGTAAPLVDGACSDCGLQLE